MAETPPSSGGGGGAGGLGSLSALKDLNWPTVILILFTGGANLFSTQRNSADREYQVQQAVNQIRDLHNALENFEKRQKQSLDNSTAILENDTVLLREVHEITTKFDEWKRAEQMRGAPP
jgi:hypothetical protein